MIRKSLFLAIIVGIYSSMEAATGKSQRATSDLETEWHAMAEKLALPSRFRSGTETALQALKNHHRPTYEHCQRVGLLAVRIGCQVGLPLRPLFYGGSLHDRGKLRVPPEILGKTVGWTDKDTLLLRDHPLDGYEETMEESMIVTAGILVRHHTFQPHPYPELIPSLPSHFPSRLIELIEKGSRVVALADFYDAAHRKDQGNGLSGEEIKAKVLDHNPDLGDLITQLYQTGIFTTDTHSLL